MSASTCPRHRLGLWPAAPVCLFATLALAAPARACRASELDGCRGEASEAPAPRRPGRRAVADEVLTRQEIDTVTDCMRSKNYLRIDDTSRHLRATSPSSSASRRALRASPRAAGRQTRRWSEPMRPFLLRPLRSRRHRHVGRVPPSRPPGWTPSQGAWTLSGTCSESLQESRFEECGSRDRELEPVHRSHHRDGRERSRAPI